MASQKFLDMIKKMEEIHIRKSHDYANEKNPFDNFDKQAELISWFTNDIDRAFVGIIGIKLARLSELLGGKEPKNESIEDTFLDLANYVVLWGARRVG